MTRLILPRGLRLQIEAEAGAAAPCECCGLIEGTRIGGTIVALALHAMRNAAGESDAFEIDPTEQIRLLRALRDSGRQIVGCYHSHPRGGPEPSPRDREGASEAGFVWLIAAAAAPTAPAIKAFLFDGSGFLPVSILETASLDPARRPRV